MSYCRFSTGDGQCDLYVYEDASGGVTIHVASYRLVYNEPLPAPVDLLGDELTEEILDRLMERNRLMDGIRARAERVRIGLPMDGKSFYCLEFDDAVATLLELKGMGYRFPDSVIESVKEDGQDQS